MNEPLRLVYDDPNYPGLVMAVKLAMPGEYWVTQEVYGRPLQQALVAESELLGFAQLYKEMFHIGGPVLGFDFRLSMLDGLRLQDFVTERMGL